VSKERQTNICVPYSHVLLLSCCSSVLTFTCLIPSFLTTSDGISLDAKQRRKMALKSASVELLAEGAGIDIFEGRTGEGRGQGKGEDCAAEHSPAEQSERGRSTMHALHIRRMPHLVTETVQRRRLSNHRCLSLHFARIRCTLGCCTRCPRSPWRMDWIIGGQVKRGVGGDGILGYDF
jgi:hypothetical protein